MQKEKIRLIEKKIIIFIIFLISLFFLPILLYLFGLRFKILEIPFLLLIFDNYPLIIYFLYSFFIFSIFYLIFELLSHFLNKKIAIIILVLSTFFLMLNLLRSVGMIDESGSFIVYLLIMTSLLLAPLLSFQKLIKGVKTKISIVVVYLIVYIIFYILFP